MYSGKIAVPPGGGGIRKSITNVINCDNNFVRKMVSMAKLFTPEQKIFMIES
jgi:hypothetical protein